MSTLCVEKKVDMKQLAKIKTPKPTKTWSPVGHDVLVNQILGQIDKMPNFDLADEPELGTSHDDLRCFGLMKLKSTSSEFCMTVGFRNSHDKAFGIAMYGGASVFICSNLQAFGDYALTTKHTSLVMDRLPILIQDGLKDIEIDGKVNEDRIETYKKFEIGSPAEIHDYMIQSMDKNIIPSDKIGKVLNEWRIPRHEEFEPRNMWSFNNCYTEVFKEYKSPEQLNHRSIALTKVMDEWTLFDPAKEREKYVPVEPEELAVAA
tara:strand:+ start:2496 stop:3281 length:786 start_codon:yes stop_codon:yes gene_type:complete